MDPNLFHVDVERTFEALLAIVVLSFFIERALALFFENKLLVNRLNETGIKEFISFAVALSVCRYWDFDALSVVVVAEKTSWLGYFITAGVIAGGSKASIKFFHDVLGVMSSAEKNRQDLRRLRKEGVNVPQGAGQKPDVATPGVPQ